MARDRIALVFFALCSPTIPAQAPSVSHVLPAGARPGEIVAVTFHGNHLADATGVWTSFPAEAVRAPGDDQRGDQKSATFWLKVPRAVPVGIGGIRVATRRGISSLRLFAIDDLPGVEETVRVRRGKSGSSADPRELAPPVAVDGVCDEKSINRYRFDASPGQRLSFEVLAERLGSRLDPVLRILDATGREIAYSDDEAGVGTD